MPPSNRPAAAHSGSRAVGPHTYAARRLLAICLAIAVLVAAIKLLGAVSGGEAGGANAGGTITTTDGGSRPTDLHSPTTLPASTAATTTTVKQMTVPTADDPAEILVLGDSDAGNFGPPLEAALEATGVAAVAIDYHVSSGLARPDYFDWPAYMRQVVPAINPDIVVATFGGNDAQGLRNADGVWAVGYNPGQGKDDTAWREEYGRRVGEAMDYLSAGNRTLIWVGIPSDDEAVNAARLKVQDEVVRAEAAKRPLVIYVDTWAMFGGVDGGWAESIVDPRDGVGKDVRRSDGFHLNETGGEILAWHLEQIVLEDLRERGAAL